MELEIADKRDANQHFKKNLTKFLSSSHFFRIYLFSVFLFSASLLFLLYSQFRNGVYAQDDPEVISLLMDQNKSISERILSTEFNRFRPGAYLFEIPLVYIIKSSYSAWIVASVIIYSLLVTQLSYLFFKYIKSLYLIPIVISLLITTRFSQGIILNFTLILETICLFFLAPLLMKFFENWHRSTFSSLKTCIALYSALILTHERYIGINLFFIFYFLLHKNYTRKMKIVYLCALTVPTMALFLLKLYVFHMPLFVGTGSSTEVGFSFVSAINFLGILLL